MKKQPLDSRCILQKHVTVLKRILEASHYSEQLIQQFISEVLDPPLDEMGILDSSVDMMLMDLALELRKFEPNPLMRVFHKDTFDEIGLRSRIHQCLMRINDQFD